MPNLKKVLTVSIAAFAAQLILNKGLYPLIGTQQTQNLFSIESITPASGIGGTQIGDKVLGYLTGYIPFDISNYSIWIAMLIGTFALVYAGFWIYEQKKNFSFIWNGSNMSSRLFAVLLYGHIVLYLALLLLKWNVPGITTTLLFGLGLNLLLNAMIVTLSERYFKWPKF
jgi:hypothetical protein